MLLIGVDEIRGVGNPDPRFGGDAIVFSTFSMLSASTVLNFSGAGGSETSVSASVVCGRL